MPRTRAGEQLNPAIRTALARSAATTRAGFFLDFDGVLAPIRADPESVQPVPGVVGQLGRLAELAAKVAIVSARPASFLCRHFGQLPAISLHGLYGLESVIAGRTASNAQAEAWLPVIRQVSTQARNDLPADVYVEDKRLSVGLHYRQNPGRRDQIVRWARAMSAQAGLIEQDGRMVIELKPPVAVDKGTAVRAELAGLQSAWYIGDDISDAQAFAAVRERQAGDSGFFGICVAVANSEAGPALEAQADFTLPGPAAMPALLDAAISCFAAGS